LKKKGNPSPLSIEATKAAAARTALFLAFQIALWSYILGTTTLLVVKSDERTGRFRDRSARLRDFAARSGVPPDLERSMDDHLRLYFANEEASDEAVLAAMPSAIRRRVLRHLFGDAIRECFLFSGTPRRFRDAVMAETRVELFLPQVDILSEGETVNEIYLIVQGSVEARPAPNRLAGLLSSSSSGGTGGSIGRGGGTSSSSSLSSLSSSSSLVTSTASADSLDAAISSSSSSSSGGASPSTTGRRILRAGDLFGELAFFTEEAQAEVVTSLEVCRVVVIPRGGLAATLRAFPAAARMLLGNLLSHAEAIVEEEFPRRAGDAEFARQLRSSPSSIGGRGRGLNGGGVVRGGSLDGAADAAVVRAAAVAAGRGGAAGDDALAGATLGARAPPGGLSAAQRAALSDLLRVRAAVAALAARAEEERTTRFLYAASRGRLPALRSELATGISPDAADYDGRTALMLASAKGHREAVTLLLSSGADPSATDNFGGSAALEAARHGHDEILDALVAGGARWHLSAVATASELCTCVSECHLPLLRR